MSRTPDAARPPRHGRLTRRRRRRWPCCRRSGYRRWSTSGRSIPGCSSAARSPSPLPASPVKRQSSLHLPQRRTTRTALSRAGLCYRHCRQMPRVDDLVGPTKDGCQIFWTCVSRSVTNVLCTVSTNLSIFPTTTSISRNKITVTNNLACV